MLVNMSSLFGADLTGVLQDTASPFDDSTNGFIYTTTVDHLGNLIVAGQYAEGALTIRYTSTGGRDGNFGANGVADLTALATTATIQKIINSPTGYFATGVSNTSYFTTIKLTDTGGLDPSFSSSGIVSEYNFLGAGYDMLLNGTALTIAGFTNMSSSNRPSVINYSSITGARNNTIGDNGLQNFQSSPGTMYGICPLNSAPANIYGTGQSLGKAFFDAFINQAGILQDSADPFRKTNNSTNNTITRLLIAPDNTILAVAIHSDFVTNWYLINYLPDGTRNPSFGTNGVGDVVYIAYGQDLVIDSDNNIFVTGSSRFCGQNLN